MLLHLVVVCVKYIIPVVLDASIAKGLLSS